MMKVKLSNPAGAPSQRRSSGGGTRRERQPFPLRTRHPADARPPGWCNAAAAELAALLDAQAYAKHSEH